MTFKDMKAVRVLTDGLARGEHKIKCCSCEYLHFGSGRIRWLLTGKTPDRVTH